MGGQISVMSEEGKGSTFIVELPFAARPKTAGDAEAAEAPAERRSSAACGVLAAEDNLVNQKVLKAIVEPMDVELAMVGDGRAAVEAWRDGDFDVILMDIQMPVMDGIAAAKAIRADEKAERARRARRSWRSPPTPWCTRSRNTSPPAWTATSPSRSRSPSSTTP